MIRLHLACGDVYLEDYINIDIGGRVIKKGEPNLNKTTLNKYFKYPFDSPRREILIDKRMNLLKVWDFKSNSISEIVMISCIEHFTKKQAKFIIQEIYRILKVGGKLIIDFPDIKKTVDKYYYKDIEFCMRLIYCNNKNKYSKHYWGYSKQSFKKLLGKKWIVKTKEIVHHCYPTISIEAIKL